MAEEPYHAGTRTCPCGGEIDVWADECSDCGPLMEEEDDD